MGNTTSDYSPPSPLLQTWYETYSSVMRRVLKLAHKALFSIGDIVDESPPRLDSEPDSSASDEDATSRYEENRTLTFDIPDGCNVAYHDSEVIKDTLPFKTVTLHTNGEVPPPLIENFKEVGNEQEYISVDDDVQEHVMDLLFDAPDEFGGPEENIEELWGEADSVSWKYDEQADSIHVQLHSRIMKRVRDRVWITHKGILSTFFPKLHIDWRYIPDDARDTPDVEISGGEITFRY